jgi:hypothetical protein
MAADPIVRRPTFPRPAARGRFAPLLVALSASWALSAAAQVPGAPGPGPLEPSTLPAVTGKPARVATKAAPALWWHDGGVRRPLTVDTALEADFTPRSGKDAAVLRPAGLTGKSAAAGVSPVLRDDTGRARALPGGVLVVLRAPLDEASARLLLAQAGAVPLRALTDTLWLVEGPTGLGSLELANRLHDSGRFASAQPNWWVQRALK